MSTKEQNLSLQVDALKKEGCQQIYQEKMSGAKAESKLKGGEVVPADGSKKKKA